MSTVFLFTWLAYILGGDAHYAYYVYFIMNINLLLVRLYFLKTMIGLKPFSFVRNVLVPIIGVAVFSCLIPYLITVQYEPSTIRLISNIGACMILTCLSIFFLGLKKQERTLIISNIKNKIYGKKLFK